MHHGLFVHNTRFQILFPARELTFSLVGNNTVIGNQYLVEIPASHLGHYSSLFLESIQTKSKMFRLSCVWPTCPYTYKSGVYKCHFECTNCRFASLKCVVHQSDLALRTLYQNEAVALSAARFPC